MAKGKSFCLRAAAKAMRARGSGSIFDGGIQAGADAGTAPRGPDGMLLLDAIARTCLQCHDRRRSAWAWEIELRPWVEKF